MGLQIQWCAWIQIIAFFIYFIAGFFVSKIDLIVKTNNSGIVFEDGNRPIFLFLKLGSRFFNIGFKETLHLKFLMSIFVVNCCREYFMFAMLAPGVLGLVIALAVFLLSAIAGLLYLILRNVGSLQGEAATKLVSVVAQLQAAHEKLAVAVEQLRVAHETLARVVEQLRATQEKLTEMEAALISGKILALESRLDALATAIKPVLETLRG